MNRSRIILLVLIVAAAAVVVLLIAVPGPLKNLLGDAIDEFVGQHVTADAKRLKRQFVLAHFPFPLDCHSGCVR